MSYTDSKLTGSWHDIRILDFKLYIDLRDMCSWVNLPSHIFFMSRDQHFELLDFEVWTLTYNFKAFFETYLNKLISLCDDFASNDLVNFELYSK